jgi:histone H1/5
MSYKAGITKPIEELEDRMVPVPPPSPPRNTCSKKWQNATFLKTLKNGVADGVFIEVKGSYQLSLAAAKKAAPKKKPVSAVFDFDCIMCILLFG